MKVVIFECKQYLTNLIKILVFSITCFAGQFLTEKILQDGSGLELAFVWNRSKDAIHAKGVDDRYILDQLEECNSRSADLIVEVAHPVIVEKVWCALINSFRTCS